MTVDPGLERRQVVELDPYVHARLRLVEDPVERPARSLLAESDQPRGREHREPSPSPFYQRCRRHRRRAKPSPQAGLEMHGGTIREGEPGGQVPAAAARSQLVNGRSTPGTELCEGTDVPETTTASEEALIDAGCDREGPGAALRKGRRLRRGVRRGPVRDRRRLGRRPGRGALLGP